VLDRLGQMATALEHKGPPSPRDRGDVKLLSDIKRCGWHVVYVGERTSSLGFGFSVGLSYSLGHPEILVIGLDYHNTVTLLNEIGSEVKRGTRFVPGVRYDGILIDYPFAFITVERKRNTELLGYACWFYQSDDFSVLQGIWPDTMGRFPWEPGCDPKVAERQCGDGRGVSAAAPSAPRIRSCD
jgi:Domain of unknown function (DUF4262)